MVMYMAHSPAWPVDRFRATLDRILDETGLSQAGLSALVPMDQSQLSRWKSGSSRPKFESLTVLGGALRAKYPTLDVGPNELLESAGYAPPEPLARTGRSDGTTDATNPELQPEHRDDSPLTVVVTVDPEKTLDELLEPLHPLSKAEGGMVAVMEASGFPPDEVAGAVIFVRRVAAVRREQHDRQRKRA